VIIEPRFSPDQSRQINDLTADGILAKDRLRMGDPAWLSMGDPGWLSFPDPSGSVWGGR